MLSAVENISEEDISPEHLLVRLNKKVDLISLKRDAAKILARYPFNDKMQVCLTHRPGVLDPKQKAYEGTGRLRGLHEMDFCIFNEEFKDTYIFNLFAKGSHAYQFGRMRLAILPSHHCYSVHRDVSFRRSHIAIYTNPKCYILFPEKGAYHIPADGFIYSMNVQEEHTALNGGDSDRIHLIMEVRPKSITQDINVL